MSIRYPFHECCSGNCPDTAMFASSAGNEAHDPFVEVGDVTHIVTLVYEEWLESALDVVLEMRDAFSQQWVAHEHDQPRLHGLTGIPPGARSTLSTSQA
jgi:hypothetical protein